MTEGRQPEPAVNSIPPRVVLIHHENDHIDGESLASWLACTFKLVGLVVLREHRSRKLARAKNEIRRSGFWHFLDVLAFRLYYRLFRARADAASTAKEVARLRACYPARLGHVPRVVAPSPNTPEVRRFLLDLRPDLMIARCKFILKPEIFNIPAGGTFVLHPGICPEYRNAHGCFWALVNRDHERVGMTLLRVDEGVDTGPVFFQGGCEYDERGESHVIIQYRVVTSNLEAIGSALLSVWKGERRPIPTEGRRSAMWGQPTLSAYARWKRRARTHRTRTARS
jgi:hypothetical protein